MKKIYRFYLDEEGSSPLEAALTIGVCAIATTGLVVGLFGLKLKAAYTRIVTSYSL